MVPVLVGLAIDRAIAGADARALALFLLLLGADFAMLSLGFRLGSRMGLLGMQGLQHRLRMTVSAKLLDPDSRVGVRDGAGLSIATSDVLRLSATVQIALYPVGEAAAILFSAITLGVIWWPLGLAVVLGGVAMVWAMGRAGGPLRARTLHQQQLAAAAVARAGDLVSGYRVIKGLRAEDTATERYRASSREALAGTLLAKTSLGFYTGAMTAIAAVFIGALVVLAGLGAVRGTVSPGSLIAVVGLSQFVIGPLRALPSNVGAVWATGVASAARVLGVLNGAADPNPSGPTDPGSAPVPTDTWNPTIPTLSLPIGPGTSRRIQLDPGEFVGVRADQSTADHLMAVLGGRSSQRPGINGRTASLSELRGTVLAAPHAAELFDGSVTWNLAMPGADADDPARMDGALRAAACEDVVAELPEGLDTGIGEGGMRLSGGQRQRLCLARALAVDPPVLVLHDPTTAVDSVTESVIAGRLPGNREGRSTLVLTASPALLAVCDRVVDLLPEGEGR
jgi:ABC-type multidrug transport system fused ATPase/permease subunit